MILIAACVLLSCVIANRFSDKLGMPALILFMGLGMLFGIDGIFKISFDNYHLAKTICNIALVFIMFYGGFGTKWEVAKPVALKSIILSTVGVLITAMLTSLFCYYVVKFTLLESFLISSVISSTDAASLFSILRSKNLSLKDGSASMLELESGSNDPVAFMLTIVSLSFINGTGSIGSIFFIIFSQIVFGVLLGVSIAVIGIFVLKKLDIVTDGLETIFIIALVLSSYSLCEYVHGSGYLSVYITGIILGNSKINNKIILVHFFDGLTGLAQIIIFFLLGLLSRPHQLPGVIGTAILIGIFLTFVARPIAVFSILRPFKCSINQCVLLSLAGLRGAASIVFATIAIADGANINFNLYHIVFMIALLSVALQGSFLPAAARKLDMIDDNSDVRKTFNDYQDESLIKLMRVFIPKGHPWEGKSIEEADIPNDSLALMIKRDDDNIVPKGDTIIKANDSVILSIPDISIEDDIKLKEVKIGKNHKWCNKTIADLNLSDDILIALIKRGEENIIPRGKTQILENDVVVMYN